MAERTKRGSGPGKMEDRAAEAALPHGEVRFRELFKHMGSGVAVYEAVDDGADFVIRDFNPAAEKIENIRKQDILGRRVTDAFPGVKELGIFQVFQRVWRTGTPEHFPAHLYKDERDPGSWRENWVFKLPTGEIVAVYNDITERVRAEEALRQTNRDLELSRTAAIDLSLALEAENEARKKSENDLREAETRYRLLFEHSPDGIVILDPATARPLEFNEMACRQLGYTREEFARLSISDLDIVETSEETSSRIAGVLREGRNDFETRHRTKSGEIRDVHVTAQIIEILGHPVYHCVWRDITERKRAEEGLRDSEENMRYIVKHDPNAIAVYDRELHYIAVSDRYLRDYDIKEEDVIGKHHYEVFPEMPQRWREVHQRCLAGAIEGNDDDSFERPDGSITYNRWECRPWRRLNGEIGGMITYTEVTTERKKAEKALRESEERYRTLFENATEAIFVVQGGKLVFCNPMTTQLMGYSGDELKARPFTEFVHPDDRDVVIERHRKRLKREEVPGRYVVRIVDRAGNSRWAEIHVILIDWEGQPATLNFANDITERKQAEEKLRESEEQLRAFMELAPDGVYLNDLAGYFLYGNRRTEEITGFRREELIGKNMMELDLLSPDELARAAELMQASSRGEPTGPDELTLRRKDGSSIIVEINTSVVRRHGQPVVVGFVRDVTERKQAEEKLRESEKQYRELYDFLPIPVYEMDLEANITAANRAIFKAFRATEEDFKKGFNAWKLLSPEDVQRSRVNIQKLLTGEAIEGTEYVFTRLDGSTFPAIVVSSVIFDRGRPLGLRGAIIDITERKQAEDSVQTALREKEILLREIHHRVKNNMQVISSLFNLQAGQITAENARRVLKEGQLRIRSMALVHEKLYQSRDLSKIDFADYLRSLAAHLFHFYRVEAGRIRLETTHLEPVYLSVNSAVPSGLLVNELVSNSLKHAFPADRKGTVEIGIRRDEDGRVELRVADDGVGLPGSLDFRRTESLGLQIVNLLADQLGGTIELGDGNGTDIRISFREPEDRPKT